MTGQCKPHTDAWRRVVMVPGGPVLVNGPLRMEFPDGTVTSSDRVINAVCGHPRGRTHPRCDTGHRRHRTLRCECRGRGGSAA
jgi:hypothetical protein